MIRWLVSFYLLVAFLGFGQNYQFHSGKKQVSLLELYSSQGCSSCPPAESWLRQFQGNHDLLWKQVVPVVFHVDYWNRIGWVDPYSSPEFTERQVDLRKDNAISSVYTPGFLVNGHEWTGFFTNHKLESLLEKTKKTNQTGELAVEIEKGLLKANYHFATEKTLTLNVAELAMDETTAIKAGENKGRQLTESFIVLRYEKYDSQNQLWQIPFQKQKNTKAIAVWITESGKTKPLQATGGYL